MKHSGRRALRAIPPILIAVAWLAALGVGFYGVMAYETTPGPIGQAPPAWPSGSTLPRVAGVPNVVMAVHPKCPCTGATLDTLAGILGRSPAGASIRLLVYRPAAGGAGWDDPTSSAPADWPGVERVDDPGGVEAARFGLATSGATSVFDAGGRRLFSGGLNATRGGREMSAGGRALLAILEGRQARAGAADAFGCPIIRDSRALGASGGPR